MVKSVKAAKKNYVSLTCYLGMCGKVAGTVIMQLPCFESELSIPCARTKLAAKDETMEAVKPLKFSNAPTAGAGASLFPVLLLDIVDE